MFSCDVWIKGIGCDNYLVIASTPREAMRECGNRIKNETNATEFEIIGVEKVRD